MKTIVIMVISLFCYSPFVSAGPERSLDNALNPLPSLKSPQEAPSFSIGKTDLPICPPAQVDKTIPQYRSIPPCNAAEVKCKAEDLKNYSGFCLVERCL